MAHIKEIKKIVCCVLLSFLLGLFLRTALLNIGEPKIVLYKTFEQTVQLDN